LGEELKETTENNKSLSLVKKKQELDIKDLKLECNQLEERAERAEFKLKDYSTRLVRKNVLYSDLTQELKICCAENKRLVSQRRKSFEYASEIGDNFEKENDQENALFEYAKRIQDANKTLHKQVNHLKDENNSKSNLTP
jgi:chromosome segregation ATPase